MFRDFDLILRERCRVRPDRPLLVGVSGGADSLCLMAVLQEAGYPLIVAHFDHTLRPESGADAEKVRAFAEKRGLPFVLGSGDVRAFAHAQKQTIEEAARTLRYTFLFQQARDFDAQAVAVGHTADDQVETVLMHFLRGSGLSGLKGMTYRTILKGFDRKIPLIRPLLDFWREETLVCCSERHLHPIIDESNASTDYFRNRLRHILIPQLETYNPRFREVLWRTSQALRSDYDILNALLESVWQETVRDEGEGYITFDAARLAKHPAGLQRNLIRRAMQHLRAGTLDISFETLQRASDFLRQDSAKQMDLMDSLYLFREEDRLYLADRDAELPNEGWLQIEGEIPVEIPCKIPLGEKWTFIAEWWDSVPLAKEQMRQSENPYEAWLDARHLKAPLLLRPRRAGDKFQALGMDGRFVKLSDFFINAKLPRRARDRWALFCTGDRIAWIPGFRPAHGFRLKENTQRVVYLSIEKRK